MLSNIPNLVAHKYSKNQLMLLECYNLLKAAQKLAQSFFQNPKAYGLGQKKDLRWFYS